MKILSQRQENIIRGDYRRRYGIYPECLDMNGCPASSGCSAGVYGRTMIMHARADAIRQALRWGEPYVYLLAPGVMSWMVPLADGERLLGGFSGGEILVENDAAQRAAAVNYLVECGCRRAAAVRYVRALPVWPRARPRAAAQHLYDLVYQVTGFSTVLLARNRENALQQRQIAEGIHARKLLGARAYPMREEQMLLSLIRVGDRNGARRLLNEALAAIFLYAPKLALIRARAIELMGMLVRTAIEDNPMQESLMERHQEWVVRIVQSADFEQLCEVLRRALDDFMDSVFNQGYNRGNRCVKRIMDYVAAHYAGALSLDDIARATGLSRCHVSRLVKKHTGRNVSLHIRSLRVNRARDLLRRTRMPCSQIAMELGYNDQSYFIRQFREMTGVTPYRYRNR